MRSLVALVVAGTTGLSAVAAPPATGTSITQIEEAIVAKHPRDLAELRERIWSTPIGLLTNDYLFQDAPPDEITRRAHQISTRIMSSVRLRLARWSAVEVMFLDLYERGRVDERVHLRMGQLQTELGLKKHIAEDRAVRQVARLWPLFVLLGTVGGSKIVREQFGALFESAMIKLGIERRANPAHALTLFQPGFPQLVAEEFFVDYSLLTGAGVAVGAAGSAAAANWYLQSGAVEGSDVVELMVDLVSKSNSNLEEL